MARDCIVDTLVRARANDLKLDQGALTRLLDLVEAEYLARRRGADPELAAQWGPELEDVATVLDHAIDHVMDVLGEQLADLLIARMERAGLPQERLTQVLEADYLRQRLQADLPGARVSVRSYPMTELHTKLVEEFGEGGIDLADHLMGVTKPDKGVLH